MRIFSIVLLVYVLCQGDGVDGWLYDPCFWSSGCTTSTTSTSATASTTTTEPVTAISTEASNRADNSSDAATTTGLIPTMTSEIIGRILNSANVDDLKSAIADFDIDQYDSTGFISNVLDTVGHIYNGNGAEETSTQAWLPLFDRIIDYAPVMESSEAENFLNLTTSILGNEILEEADVLNSSEILNVALKIENYSLAVTKTILEDPELLNAGVRILDFEFATITACSAFKESCELNSSDAYFVPKNSSGSYITYVVHKNLHYSLSSSIASRIISVTSHDGNVKTSSAIEFTMKHLRDFITEEESSCQFFNESTRSWSTNGCLIVSRNATHTRCSCNHMTNFAILFLHSNLEITEEEGFWLDVITYVGCGISITSLIVTMSVFAMLKLHRSERVILLWHLSFCLCVAQVILLSGINAEVGTIKCKVIAILLHFFFMSSFSWMLMEGLQLYYKAVRAVTGGFNIKAVLALGWAIPILVVAISLGVAFDGYGTERGCWLSISGGLVWAFIGPALAFIVINCVLLTAVMRVFLQLKSVSKRGELERTKRAAKAVALILPLLGITWILGVLAVDASTKWFIYLFSIFNSLQGLVIFILHCLRNDEVRKAFVKKYHRNFSMIEPSSTNSSSLTPRSNITFVGSFSGTSPMNMPKVAKW